MTEEVPIQIANKPGVKRDGTILEGDNYIDAQHTRFNSRGLPQKMGGYEEKANTIANIGRGIFGYSRNTLTYVHVGSRSELQRLTINNTNGQATGTVNRTPSGFQDNSENTWQMDAMYDSNQSATMLIAHASQNLTDISNETGNAIFIGNITLTTNLTQVSAPSSGNPAGGIVVLHPYLFYYGAQGVVGWSVANQPTDLSGAGSGAARVTESKVVKGLPLRGGPGNAPSGLFWALNELVRISFVGGAAIFQADTLSSTITVLSPAAIIENDGIYYWPGIDRFYVFNGVVRELPNTFCRDFFYKNLNYQYRVACFATKVTAFGEIWFCFPYGSATECTHAIIYNYRFNCWYDTILPNGGRSCGVWAQVYQYPLMTGTASVGGTTKLWQHEMMQYDEILQDGTTNAIQAYFETNEKSFAVPEEGGKPSNASISTIGFEPDFVQSGPMLMQVRGRPNSRAPVQTSQTYQFQATDATVDVNFTSPALSAGEQRLGTKETRRLIRWRFESNVAGGNFEMGQPLAQIVPGDKRTTS